MTAAVAKRVGVIGAGIAGLVTAKVLREDGFDVTVFEKSATIGGVWAASRTYPGLRANNPRDLYAFSDHPFAATAGDFPSAEQMRVYLASYARRFGLDEHVRLATEVVSVERAEAKSGSDVRWRLRVRSADTVRAHREVRSGGAVRTHREVRSADAAHAASEEDETLEVDYVVVCNGVFSAPRVPAFEGAQCFEGRIRHSSELADACVGAGQRVVVVGGSKSAVDCAMWAAREGASSTLVFRSPYWMWPRYLFGFVNLQWLMFSRASASMLGAYGASTDLRARLEAHARPMIAAAWRLLARVLRRHAGGGGALVPDFDPPEHIETMGVGNEAYRLVREGKIVAKRAEIRRFTGAHTVELTSGETLEADLVVLATGFTQELAFLEPAVRRDLERHDGFRLFRMILPPEHPTLALNGYNSSTMCQLTAEIAAHWISECFQGRLALPSVAAMDAQIDARKAWLARAMPSKGGGYFIGPWVIAYVDELLRDMGLPTRRRNPFAEAFLPAWPSRYATVGAERRRRAQLSPLTAVSRPPSRRLVPSGSSPSRHGSSVLPV